MTAILRTQQQQQNTNMKLIWIWIHKAGNHTHTQHTTHTHEHQKNIYDGLNEQMWPFLTSILQLPVKPSNKYLYRILLYNLQWHNADIQCVCCTVNLNCSSRNFVDKCYAISWNCRENMKL